MKLHAGSLYKNYLVLYGENETPRVVQVSDKELQWKIYCNDVDVDHQSEHSITIKFEGNSYLLPCIVTNNPMKTLGF